MRRVGHPGDKGSGWPQSSGFWESVCVQKGDNDVIAGCLSGSPQRCLLDISGSDFFSHLNVNVSKSQFRNSYKEYLSTIWCEKDTFQCFSCKYTDDLIKITVGEEYDVLFNQTILFDYLKDTVEGSRMQQGATAWDGMKQDLEGCRIKLDAAGGSKMK